jgi:hypothetical protein
MAQPPRLGKAGISVRVVSSYGTHSRTHFPFLEFCFQRSPLPRSHPLMYLIISIEVEHFEFRCARQSPKCIVEENRSAGFS